MPEIDQYDSEEDDGEKTTSSSTSSATPTLPTAGSMVGKPKKKEIFKNLKGRDGGEPTVDDIFARLKMENSKLFVPIDFVEKTEVDGNTTVKKMTVYKVTDIVKAAFPLNKDKNGKFRDLKDGFWKDFMVDFKEIPQDGDTSVLKNLRPACFLLRCQNLHLVFYRDAKTCISFFIEMPKPASRFYRVSL
jgi:hypothetical protein